ncbi:MAG: hypothetical protein WD801_00845 [Gemmatimonadaceae bacterium]
MRMLLGLLLGAHAIAHLPGFLYSWRWMSEPGGQYRTTILGGRVNVGAVGIRVVGVFWLLAAVAVGVAAVHMFRLTQNAVTLTWIAVTLSSIMTIVGWPGTKTGVVLNAVIIASLVWVALASR